jgi:imidazole glycerol-phosphate synthase subunit HisH
MKVALLDYGAGNVASVGRALERLGIASQRTSAPEEIRDARAVLLPGVGHYAALIRELDGRGLRGALVDAIGRGVPFLGICLGLQVLFETSAEAPELKGLGLLPGAVHALPGSVKLPHMGWNRICGTQESRLLAGVSPRAYFYFAHSYAVRSEPASRCEVARCSYGTDFVAVLEERNLFGVQFHPEKSGVVGAQILRNFLELLA